MFADTTSIEEFDPDLFAAIAAETRRQEEHIELIASENYASPRVMEAQGSVLTNKYAEGYPGKRYYGGCEHVDVAETLAIERAKELFGADYANVQPHSGSQANTAVYLALLRPGDTIRMAYLWQCPPGSSSYGLMTFVHFTCGDHAFSDDHPLLEGVRREDLLYQPFEESFIVERSVRIPHDTPAGDYRVGLGVYRPSTGERLKVRTRLPHRRGEGALPVVIRVRGE